MNLNLLQFLTYTTVAGAIASALALAAAEARMSRPVVVASGSAQPLPALPAEPTAAGNGPPSAASAARPTLPPSP